MEDYSFKSTFSKVCLRAFFLNLSSRINVEKILNLDTIDMKSTFIPYNYSKIHFLSYVFTICCNFFYLENGF